MQYKGYVGCEFCNPDCKYLSITEEVQNKLYSTSAYKPCHFCKKYYVRVIHRGHHPNLVKHEECVEEV